MKSVEEILKRVIVTRMEEAEFRVEVLRGAVCEDPNGRIEPGHVRHLLEICTGRAHTTTDAVGALSALFPRGYMCRPFKPGKPRDVRVFVGARIRSPKRLFRFVSKRFRHCGHNSAKRRGWFYLAKLADWSQYPKDEKQIFERFALFGEYPRKIAYHLDLPRDRVRAVLTKHKIEAGISIDSRSERRA
jgi:hypothetical protein